MGGPAGWGRHQLRGEDGVVILRGVVTVGVGWLSVCSEEQVELFVRVLVAGAATVGRIHCRCFVWWFLFFCLRM